MPESGERFFFRGGIGGEMEERESAGAGWAGPTGTSADRAGPKKKLATIGFPVFLEFSKKISH